MDYVTRRERLFERLSAAGIDALLVNRVTNIRYLTGFSGSAGFLLFSREPILVVDFRYDEQARAEADTVTVDGTARPPTLWSRACSLVAASSAARIGIESKIMSVSQHRELRELGRQELVETTNLVEGLRAVKDEEEQALLLRASGIADRVFSEIRQLAAPGMTENEVAGEIERLQRQQGAERSAAPLIVASGPRTSLPHGVASGRVIESGEPLMVDLSPVVGGYRGDLTRTVHFGPPPREFARIYRIVCEALDRAIKGLRPGMLASDVDAIARDHIAASGFGEFFNHSLGHGIGLDQHEGPLLSPDDQTLLVPGMVVTIEPGIYVPGSGGVRIEDAVIVTEDGCDVLTTSSHDLLEF